MSSAEVIDALFVRTVDIVQSLPKTGPIQTSYEEKLALYSLYKQATEGDVQSKRPGMLDMLGRAKYDAWANRRGLARQDAKQLYVESMLKTLRKFSDRPQAIALIEELESFSGDVAQRVMSASLARHDDSDSDSLSADEEQEDERLSPVEALRRTPLPPIGAAEEEDERDALSQLPQTHHVYAASSARQTGMPLASAPGLRSGQRTPLSVEGASAMAVRGVPQAGYGPSGRGADAGSSIGGGSVTEEENDIETNRRLSGAELAARRSTGLRSSVASRGMSNPQGSWQRTGGVNEGRLYAVPGQRYPHPSASDAPGGGGITGATMGGGAGASLYSAVGPSARPTASEQHFYHHHGGGGGDSHQRGYAPPSSVGGRSGGGGGGQHSRNIAAGRAADVDLALQSIQASLSALHERLNRVEGRGGRGSGSSAARGSGAFGAGYRALADALHDIAVLLGLQSDGRGGVAPLSYRGGDGAESQTSRAARNGGGGNRRGQGVGGEGGSSVSRRRGFWLFARLLLALAQVALRIALDATSIVVVLSLVLLIIQRTTGRGDPLLILRLMRRWLGVRVPTTPRATVRAVQQIAR